MKTLNQIEATLKELEKKHLPDEVRHPVCFVHVGEDYDEVVNKFRLDNNVQDGDHLHICEFVTPETVSRTE